MHLKVIGQNLTIIGNVSVYRGGFGNFRMGISGDPVYIVVHHDTAYRVTVQQTD